VNSNAQLCFRDASVRNFAAIIPPCYSAIPP
jgi:hypothetical protein